MAPMESPLGPLLKKMVLLTPSLYDYSGTAGQALNAQVEL